MFELTNDQRKCFALNPISDQWECMEAKPSPYDQYKTYLYLDGNTIVKCIICGESRYTEYELSEGVSEDRKYLLPKAAKGKPVLLSASTIEKRHGVGMRLNYSDKYINLYNENTECSYFFNSYLEDDVHDFDSFSQWVTQWCEDTTSADLEEILRFSQQRRKHICYQEGDVFRFKIGRRLYGYGRVLLDYVKMRKRKEPFWDILMGTPLVCSVYHIVTERKDVTVNELKKLPSLPSVFMQDNSLFYGEYEIIGNLPITEYEDYPIMYGNSIRAGEKAIYFQCGKIYRKIENKSTLLCGNFRNNGIYFSLNFKLDILMQCIAENSNQPYWTHYYPSCTEGDLRNPKYANKLQLIKKQFEL